MPEKPEHGFERVWWVTNIEPRYFCYCGQAFRLDRMMDQHLHDNGALKTGESFRYYTYQDEPESDGEEDARTEGPAPGN